MERGEGEMKKRGDGASRMAQAGGGANVDPATRPPPLMRSKRVRTLGGCRRREQTRLPLLATEDSIINSHTDAAQFPRNFNHFDRNLTSLTGGSGTPR